MSTSESTIAAHQRGPAAPESTQGKAAWNPVTRIAFRFAFAYFTVYGIPHALGWLPGLDWVAGMLEELWHRLVPWVAAHVLRLSHPITTFTNGSADTSYDYVLNLCLVMMAVVAAIVWSLLDRKRLSYPKLHQWLRLWVRLALGAVLISYGASKVIPFQFTPPTFMRLLERYGDSSPMGLLWTFMGFSPAYTIFTGLVELTGGVLVIVPRLTTLGALISAAAMTNVFLLNMCYDVPVKLFSFNLLLMAVLLALPDFPRLANVLIFNREAPARADVPLFRRRAFNIMVLVLLWLFCGYHVSIAFYTNYQYYKTYVLTKPPLYGIWAVEEFSVDGEPQPPLITDQARWQRVVFWLPTIMSLQLMNGSLQHCRVTVDMEKKTLVLTKSADPNWKASLSFSEPQAGVLVLYGQFDGHNLDVKTRLSDSKFVLTTRGFHWISERSFIR